MKDKDIFLLILLICVLIIIIFIIIKILGLQSQISKTSQILSNMKANEKKQRSLQIKNDNNRKAAFGRVDIDKQIRENGEIENNFNYLIWSITKQNK